jgi:hypothetical protein
MWDDMFRVGLQESKRQGAKPQKHHLIAFSACIITYYM